MQKKHIVLVAAVAAVLLVGLIIYVLSSDGGRRGTDGEFDLEERLYEQGRKGDGPDAHGTPGEALARTAETQETLLRDTMMFYRYPPRSRPLTKKMKDLLNPFALVDGPHPIFLKEKPEPGTPPIYMYQLSSDQRSITEKEAFVARLQVWQEPQKANVLPKILEATVHSDNQTGRIKVGDARYNDDGKEGDRQAGDRVLTFTWTPPYGGRLYWGELDLRIKFQLPDGKTVAHALTFHSTPTAPARFTGEFSEELVNGSLVIRPELEVKQRGVYMFDANLFQKDDNEPTHWVRAWAQLQPGRHKVDLLFFGKIFHDKRAEGRFVLRQLRAYRQNEVDFDINRKVSQEEMDRITSKTQSRNEPLNQYLPLTREYTTKSYSLRDFSTDEYQGPDKARRLEAVRASKFK